MLNKMITITSLFVMLLPSVSGYARVKWNEYYLAPFYYNYEGQNIEIGDLPSLPLGVYNRIELKDIHSSSLIPMGEPTYSVLDSLLRFDIIDNMEYHYWVNNRDNRGRIRLGLYNKRILISNQIDSYLVYVTGIDDKPCLPQLYLLNVKDGCLKSVLFLSKEYAEMDAYLQGGSLVFYGRTYRSMLEGNLAKQWCESRRRRLTKISVNNQGFLSVQQNYALLYPQIKHNSAPDYLDNPWLASRYSLSDTVLYSNYKTEGIVLSTMPRRRTKLGRKIDIKRIRVTPTMALSPKETAVLGPALSRENWKNNYYYWLGRVHCQDSVISYLVLSISVDLDIDPRVFMINFKDNRLTSVVRVSSIGYRDVYNGLLYRRSECHKGWLSVNLEYGNNASSPLTLYVECVDDLLWDSIVKKGANMNQYKARLLSYPEGSHYEVYLDKDGFLEFN